MKRAKILSLLLSFALLLSLVTLPAAAGDKGAFPDVEGHWSEESVGRWAGYGVLNGDENGTFSPDKSMTRAEFATMLVNLMGYTEKAQNTFQDVAANAWYADAILKLAAAGVMKGDGVNANPDTPISREEAAVLLCRAMGIEPGGDAGLEFVDRGAVSPWAQGAVAALSERGMISGVGENTFAPGLDITRAAVAKMVDNMVAAYVVDDAAELTGEINGVVIVAANADVVLKDAALSENLIVAPKAGEAAVTLAGKTVAEGKILVNSASSSLTVEKTAAAGDIMVSAPKAQVVVEGKAGSVAVSGRAGGASLTVAETASVDSVSTEAAGTKMEVAGEVKAVAVAESAAGADITVSKGAKVDSVALEAEGAKLAVAGAVKNVEVAPTASGTALTVEKGATVSKLETSADGVKVDGKGKVENMTVTAGEGVSVSKDTSVKVENKGDSTVSVGDKDVKPGGSGTGSGTTGSGGGSSSGGSSHSHSYVDGICSCGGIDPAAAQADSEETLAAALAGEAGTIVLTANITTAAQVNVTRAVTINGNGKTLTASSRAGEAAQKAGILVSSGANAVKITNLTVSGPNTTPAGNGEKKWDDGEYGIKVYDSTQVLLDKVTVTAANAGIQVNSATVALSGTVTVSGNEWGGIEVCKSESGDALPAGTLNINGATVVCTDQDIPAVWIDGTTADAGIVNGAEKLYTYTTPAPKPQIYYFTDTACAGAAAAVTGRALYTGLAAAMAAARSGDTVKLLKDTAVDAGALTAAWNRTAEMELTLDLGQKTLTVTGQSSVALGYGDSRVPQNTVSDQKGFQADYTIKNGSIIAENTAGGTIANFVVETGQKLTLNGVDGDMRFRGNGSAFFVRGRDAALTVIDSKITSTGVYAVSTNANNEVNYGVKIDIRNSELVTDSSDGDNCALCVNVPATVTIADSNITGERQAVLIRAGTVTMTNCTLTAQGLQYNPGQGNLTKFYEEDKWGGGDEVPYGALVVGRGVGTGTSYPGPIELTLDKCTFSCSGAAEELKDYESAVYIAKCGGSNTLTVTANDCTILDGNVIVKDVPFGSNPFQDAGGSEVTIYDSIAAMKEANVQGTAETGNDLGIGDPAGTGEPAESGNDPGKDDSAGVGTPDAAGEPAQAEDSAA